MKKILTGLLFFTSLSISANEGVCTLIEYTNSNQDILIKVSQNIDTIDTGATRFPIIQGFDTKLVVTRAIGQNSRFKVFKVSLQANDGVVLAETLGKASHTENCLATVCRSSDFLNVQNIYYTNQGKKISYECTLED